MDVEGHARETVIVSNVSNRLVSQPIIVPVPDLVSVQSLMPRIRTQSVSDPNGHEQIL